MSRSSTSLSCHAVPINLIQRPVSIISLHKGLNNPRSCWGLSHLSLPSGLLHLLFLSLLTRLTRNNRFVDMNILPIVPNAIANRTSEPNKNERKPNASINASPTPFLSFPLVSVLPDPLLSPSPSMNLRMPSMFLLVFEYRSANYSHGL